ncbi:hypothetical protein LTR53_018507, partial [Teratosphaeriaceae sp. CCFEE 6253]
MFFYYLFNFSKKPATPRKAYFNIFQYLPRWWSKKQCLQLMKPLVTKCKHKGLVMGGFAGDTSSHFEIDNDPDLHDPGKVPDPSKRQVPAARPASDGEASRAGAGGGQFDCAARSESHVDRSTAVDTIRYFCDGNAGHQFPANGSEHVLFAWYYNPNHPADAHTPIGLGVYQP